MTNRFSSKPIEQKEEGFNLFDFGKGAVIGAVRTGEQIPRYAGNIAGTAFGLAGKTSGKIGSWFGVDEEDNIFAQGGRQLSETTKKIGNDITESAEKAQGLSPDEVRARRFGANVASSFAIPGGAALKSAKGLTGLAATTRLGLQGAKAGAIGTTASAITEEGRLPTMGEVGIGTAVGAVATPLVTKTARVVGSQIGKGIEKVKLMKNPDLYTKKVDADTIADLSKVIKTPAGKMTEGQMRSKQAILLQGVKDVAKEGGKVTDIESAIKETSKLKAKLIEQQKMDNTKVTKITKADEMADEIDGFVGENDRMEGGLKERLKGLAEKIRTNPNYKSQFDNASQSDLQDLLTQYNGKLSDRTFLNSAKSDQIEEALMMSKILRNKIDNNIADELGIQGNQELRSKMGRLIELEKNLVSAYTKSTGKNSTGLLGAYSDLLSVDVLFDIARGNWANVASNVVKKAVLNQSSEARDVNNIIRKIFEKQRNIKNAQKLSKKLKP